jgi:hypothetical protein
LSHYRIRFVALCIGLDTNALHKTEAKLLPKAQQPEVLRIASFLKHKLWRISNTLVAKHCGDRLKTTQVADWAKKSQFGARWHASCLSGFSIPFEDKEIQ